MLPFSCISSEDSELVELNAVHKRNPGMHKKALVGLAIHANLWILCVHLIHDPVPISSCLADDKEMEQFVSLLGLLGSDVLLGLEGFLEIAQFLLSCFFLGCGLIIWKLE